MQRSLLAAALLSTLCGATAPEPPEFGWGDRWPDNHLWPADVRANLRLPSPPATGRSAAVATVPWYRRDVSPGPNNSAVAMYCGDAVTPVGNVHRIRATQAEGVYAFEPVCGASANYSMYYVTFLPGTNDGASAAWRTANRLTDADIADGRWASNLNATFVGLENRDNFTGFTSMELAASAAEVRTALAQCAGCPFLLYPEDRMHIIRMHNFAPRRWFTPEYASERKDGLFLDGQLDEYVTFQVGVLAAAELHDLRVTFAALEPTAASSGEGRSTTVIPADAMHCMNTNGSDDQGRPYNPRVNVSAGSVQALWMGVMVPADAATAVYHGIVTIAATIPGGTVYSLSVPLFLNVSSDTAEQHGDTEGWRASRVRWLDSTLGIDDEPSYPFTPMVVEGTGQHATVELLGRRITLDEVDQKPPAVWNTTATALSWPHKGKASVSWESTATSTDGTLRKVTSILAEADGYLEAQVSLSAVGGKAVSLSRVALAVPMNASAATSTFQMGLGYPGQTRRVNGTSWLWAADLPKATHMAWIGGGTAGMRLKLKGEERHWDDPMWNGVEAVAGIPRSWGGDHKDGGCRIAPGAVQAGATVLLECASGALHLKAGETITYRFDLLVTPFRKPDVAEHFAQRTLQIGYPSNAMPFYDWYNITNRWKASVINLHQGTVLNPYISYLADPDTVDTMGRFVQQAHQRDLRVKAYFTVRELTLRAAEGAEFWAATSLGDEVILPRYPKDLRGDMPDPWDNSYPYGNSWLKEHLLTATTSPNNSGHCNASQRPACPGLQVNYSPAYSAAIPSSLSDPTVRGRWDLSVHVSAVSRWNNWYVEALNHAVRNPPHLDGLYLDGAGFDRRTIQRARKVLDAGCANRTGVAAGRGLIDLHMMQTCNGPNCANTGYAHYGNVSAAMRFMQHMPYFSSLWFGEGFTYSRDYGGGCDSDCAAAHWFTEISGLAFGLFSEMLGGSWSLNPWLAVPFAMTGRNPQASEASDGIYHAATDPVPMYNFWDERGLGNTSMCGWWQEGCAVTVQQGDVVKLTTFTYGSREQAAQRKQNEQEDDGAPMKAKRLHGSSDDGAATPYSVLSMASFAPAVGIAKLRMPIRQLRELWGVDADGDDDAFARSVLLFAPPIRAFQPARRFKVVRVGDDLLANVSIGAVGQTPEPANSSCPPPDVPVGWNLLLCGDTGWPCEDAPAPGPPAPPPPPGPHPPPPPAPASVAPFCVDTNHGQVFIKVGGDPHVRSGWDGGTKDKCCRDAPASCRWFASSAACEAALKAPACLACKGNASNVGCPQWKQPRDN